MLSRNTPRLTRERILDSALEVARRTESTTGKAVTGASLGAALAVDRSAIWRHFADKDDLLLAIADRMIGIVLAELGSIADPRERLEKLFEGFIEVFGRYPHVGAELGPRTFTRENGNHAWELVMSTLLEIGVPRRHLVLEFRVFADVMIALAASNALHLQRSREDRDRDESAARAAVYRLSGREFPVTVADIDAYVSIADEEIGRGFLRAFWAGIDRYAAPNGV